MKGLRERLGFLVGFGLGMKLQVILTSASIKLPKYGKACVVFKGILRFIFLTMCLTAELCLCDKFTIWCPVGETYNINNKFDA